MNIDKLKDSIKSHEGLKLNVYRDTRGFLTAGFGHNLSAKGISLEVANLMLSEDIQSVIDTAQKQSWWPIVANDDVRSRSMLEILFNIGLGGLNTFKVALAALESRDFNGAADAFMNSDWSHQVGQRAITLTEMLRTGTDISPVTV